MGLSHTTVRFPQGIPAFSAIKRQYKVQTGLDITLNAKIHLVEGDLAELTTIPSQVLPLLNADAAAVQHLEAAYNLEKQPYLVSQQYEKAAAIRDRIKADKLGYNHIQNLELAVSYAAVSHNATHYEPFYSIEFQATSDTVTVEQYSNQHYAVDSLVKVLVDLGGVYLSFSSEVPQPLPNRWNKLKPWKEYKWYNRPKK